MLARRHIGRWLTLVVLAAGPTGCGVVGIANARDAWSTPGAPVTESMLPPPATSTTEDQPKPGILRFFSFFTRGWGRGGVGLGGHDACGPDDDACAARLRSAPIHAADWRNRFPML